MGHLGLRRSYMEHLFFMSSPHALLILQSCCLGSNNLHGRNSTYRYQTWPIFSKKLAPPFPRPHHFGYSIHICFRGVHQRSQLDLPLSTYPGHEWFAKTGYGRSPFWSHRPTMVREGTHWSVSRCLQREKNEILDARSIWYIHKGCNIETYLFKKDKYIYIHTYMILSYHICINYVRVCAWLWEQILKTCKTLRSMGILSKRFESNIIYE